MGPEYDHATLAAYEPYTSATLRRDIRKRAEQLADVRILHVNSTSKGGGVAENLRSLVPLFEDVGVDTDWFVMEAEDAFFEVTKTLHNGLQGRGDPLTDDARDIYEETTDRNAHLIESAYDLIVLHDPQPLGMIDVLESQFPETRFAWRCHIDLTEADEEYLAFIHDYVQRMDRVIVSWHGYKRRVDGHTTYVIPPSIDPLSTKNRSLTPEEERDQHEVLVDAGLDLDAPLITQVSRFDPWKGQRDAIEAFHTILEHVPDAQLVLAGGSAADDPEGDRIFREIAAEAADEPQVYLLRDKPDITINALQRWSSVVLQPSISEGFGLVVAEALWKQTPVVGSSVGGIPQQIEDGYNGYLTRPGDPDRIATCTRSLLENDEERQQFGQRARQKVRRQFLLPRQLADYLEQYVAMAV